MVEVTNKQTSFQDSWLTCGRNSLKEKENSKKQQEHSGKKKAEGAGSVPFEVLKTGGDSLRQRYY